MTVNPEQAIKNLQQAIARDDHNEAYEYSKILLKQSPQDQEYQKCLIISSLKINVLDDLQVLFKNPPNKDFLKPFYVYYLYFIGEYEKTIVYLENLLQKSNDSSYKILLAQAYFKMNNQAASAKIMLQLLKDSNKMERQDLQFYLVNLFATSINKSLDQTIVNKYRNIIKEKYSRDVYYNYALLLVSMGDYKTALEYLAEFERNLKKGEDDDQIRMNTILKDFIHFKTPTQKNLHLTMDSKQKQLKIVEYEKMEQETTEANLKNVIKNNKIFLKYQNSDFILENFHQILKAIDEGLEKKSKTTKTQQFVLKLNKLNVLLKKNRISQASKILKDLQNNFDAELYSNNNNQFLKGKYFFLKKSTKENLNENSQLLGFIDNLRKMHNNLAFCFLADLKREEGREKELVSELKEQTSHSSIIKNFVFSLLIKNPDLFEEFHQYLEELLQKANDFKILDILLRLYESKQDLSKQEKVLKKILKINPKDFDSKVKLADIYINQRKFVEAEQLLRGVQEPQEITDINYLQHIQKNIHISIRKDDEVEKNIPTIKKADQKQTITNQQIKKRIKKKRKQKLPKNMEKFIQGFKGDPERWLPKWQRKGYKKKGKKGAGKTQGLATVGKQQTKNVFTTNASTSAKEVTKEAIKKRK